MNTQLQICCQFPGCQLPADRNRQITAYNEDELNYSNLCFIHQKEADEYWQEKWQEYYSSIL